MYLGAVVVVLPCDFAMDLLQKSKVFNGPVQKTTEFAEWPLDGVVAIQL